MEDHTNDQIRKLQKKPSIIQKCKENVVINKALDKYNTKEYRVPFLTQKKYNSKIIPTLELGLLGKGRGQTGK